MSRASLIYSEFQTSYNYMVRLGLKKKRNIQSLWDFPFSLDRIFPLIVST